MFKRIIKAISLYDWKHKRKQESYNFLVVDMNQYATYSGSFSHYEAYKTEMFVSLENANKFIEDKIAKTEQHNAVIYQMVSRGIYKGKE